MKSGKILYYFSRNDQTNHRWDKSVASRHLSALCAFSGGAGRADAMGSAADRHIIDGCQRRLLGINHLQLMDAPLFQFPPHDPGKGAN